MKNLLFIVMLLVAVSGCNAASGYKILKLNSTAITCNGRPCRVNGIIADLKAIKWSSENDALQLRDLSNGHMLIWSAKKQKRRATDCNGLIVSDQLSSRDLMDLPELIDELSDVVLFDQWRAYTMYPTNDECRFEISFDINGKRQICPLAGTPDGEIIISRDIFTGVNGPEIIASVDYIIGETERVPVTDQAVIRLTNPVE